MTLRGALGLRWFFIPILFGFAALGAFATEVAPMDSSAELQRLRDLQAREMWAETDSLAQSLLTSLESDLVADSLAIADCSLALATARFKSASLSDGSALLAAQRGLGIRQRRLGSEHLETATAHSIVARVLAGSDQGERALVEVRRAIEIRTAQLAADDPLIAENWAQLGSVQRSRRDLSAALDSYQHAAELLRQRYPSGHTSLALALAEIGDCWSLLDDVDRARESLGQSIAMYRRILGPDAYELHQAYSYLATAEGVVGNLARAAELLQEALRVLRLNRPEGDPQISVLRANLANSLMRFGDYPGARAIQRELLPQFEARYGAKHARTLSLRGSLGIACGGMGDYEASLFHLRAVEASLLEREGPPPAMLAIALRFQAEVLHLQDKHQVARQTVERGIAAERLAQRPYSDGLMAMHYLLLSTLEALGDYAALDSTRVETNRLAEKLNIAAGDGNPTLLYWNARVDRDLGNFEPAWTAILEADQLARERVLSNVRALPDRRALQLSRNQSRYLDLLLDLSAQADSAQLAIAWDRLVQTRGLVRDEVSARHLPWELRDDVQLVMAHDDWRIAQQRFAQRMVNVGNAEDDSLLTLLKAQAEASEHKYATALGERSWARPSAVSLAAVRAKLQPGAALVSLVEIYAASDTTSVIAFISRAGEAEIQRIALGRSEQLAAEIEAWHDELSHSPLSRSDKANAEKECRRLGRRVRTLTWDLIAPLLGDATDVYLVADGPMLELPWQALPDQGESYLVERGPRLHLLQAERELLAAQLSTDGPMLALGAPDFERSSQPQPTNANAEGANLVVALRGNPSPCADLRQLALAPLPATAHEARAAANAWQRQHRSAGKSTLLLGGEASEASLKRLAAGHEILHIATHGVVAADSCAAPVAGTRGVGGLSVLEQPKAAATETKGKNSEAAAKNPKPAAESVWADRNVWIALAGANQAFAYEADENEGLLTAEEVVTLDLNGTRWVVLSACHSAAGGAWSREGTLGMRRAFHLAGARTVIASQWAVEDESAREWMQALYAAQTNSAATAMQHASRSVLERRRKDRQSTHPFYWAAFSASGE